MFRKVLVANRGEIAERIVRTLRRMGIGSVAVHSDVDSDSLHVLRADEAHCLGEAEPISSYLRASAVIETARRCGAQAIHPGYGFLSENAAFAKASEEAGIAFVGPTPTQIRKFGAKHVARAIATAQGVPLCPGSELLESSAAAATAARAIGFPVILKSSSGGGGIGMEVCREPNEIEPAFERIVRLARSHFGDGGVFVERFVERARHVEVQIFGDGAGRVVVLGDRDCSAQRRNQKVIEEAPAPGIAPGLRASMHAAAKRLGESVGYRSAGTVEFVVDTERGEAYFLEVNTRLQVEHGVSEAVYDIDLVEWMLRVAAGDVSPLEEAPATTRGHAIEARLYAEDPAAGFQPSSGLLTRVGWPADARIDTWVRAGSQVTPFYDPLLAKIIVHRPTRDQACDAIAAALDQTRIDGIETNRRQLGEFVASEAFRSAAITTASLAGVSVDRRALVVVEPGSFSTIQEAPGRTGYWHVGVPPSGPMDALSFRIGNRCLGNAEGTAGLELTSLGASLRFDCAATVLLAGAPIEARIGPRAVACFEPVTIERGEVLVLGEVGDAGWRSYLLVRGGFDVPEYLGSRATFTLGGFGGHAGRPLRAGDVLHLRAPASDLDDVLPAPLAHRLAPQLAGPGEAWELGVLDGPHGAPDFFSQQGVRALEETEWRVHYNSSRTGVRLIGPRPEWARSDGGEAGLHPSNIHDTAYAPGAVDFTGDMPVILGPDGPSLGGFVCPFVVAEFERWKLGQLRPGDRMRFRPLDRRQALRGLREQDRQVRERRSAGREPVSAAPTAREPVLRRLEADATASPSPGVTYRQAGDGALLVEYGPMVLDLALRLRVHALMQAIDDDIETGGTPELLERTPGIRSLQLRFDPRSVDASALVDRLVELEARIPDPSKLEIPTRTVHLPLSWDDPAARKAVSTYERVVRNDAPWCPSNLEFIRRINGLDSIDEVRRIVFDARYLVLGLGDVYLGAPVAVPLDPRHRLVTTKYNPARTWTPENAVGIGGSYLCVYGMEGPGGYQLLGRTVPMWNSWRETDDFRDGKPWLLRLFDQIVFEPVGAEELLETRARLREGRASLRIEASSFSLARQTRELAAIAPQVTAFRTRQQAAFAAERERWAALGEFDRSDPLEESVAEVAPAEGRSAPEGGAIVKAPLGARVSRIEVAVGDEVSAESTLALLEAMKMETPVLAPAPGRVLEILCRPGQVVSPGTALVALGPLEAGT